MLSACVANKGGSNAMRARITYYNPHEDQWGSKVAQSPKMRAKEGITVAAHPAFPFNTPIFIPDLEGILGDGKFVVQDRGSAVTKMKASKKEAFVFDVYLNRTRRATRNFANKMPPYMDVIVGAKRG